MIKQFISHCASVRLFFFAFSSMICDNISALLF